MSDVETLCAITGISHIEACNLLEIFGGDLNAATEAATGHVTSMSVPFAPAQQSRPAAGTVSVLPMPLNQRDNDLPLCFVGHW